MTGKHHLSLLSLFSLFLLTHAKLDLDHSNHDAISIIQIDLGFNSLNTPCHADRVFCEWRISNNSHSLQVTRIVLNSSQLTGFLSPAIGRLSELKELSLQNNHLVDQIPHQIVDCRKLEILNLHNNQLSGEIPMKVSSLVRLRILDLSYNNFSGNLDFLKYFPNLVKLSLENNMFSGKVPVSLRLFRNLRFFNVTGNSFLEGPIMVIKKVDYSSAELMGKNPIQKRYILTENSATPIISINQTAEAAGPSTTATTNSPTKKKRKLWAMILGLAAGALGLGVAAVFFKPMMIWVRSRRKKNRPAIFSPIIKKPEDLAFLEKADASASLEVIGRGGCGEVYKAELPGSDGKMIAIKKIIQPPRDAAELMKEDSNLLSKKMRQIRSEIQTVGQIRHPNVLPLLAHVPRPDCHYLVFELMKNGSLQDILNKVSQGTRELDWLARHKIALGVVAGLEYLHMNHNPGIIHRDLKPGNILLDDDLEARITDFGFAKAFLDEHPTLSTSNIAGSVGYIAPEYHQTLKFTEKCDIYSLGVVLGVLVIGKLPSDDFFQTTTEMSLVKWMRNVMTSEDPKRVIDPRLMGNGHEKKMLLVLKIACFCTLDDPKQRPNSKDVRCMLAQITP